MIKQSLGEMRERLERMKKSNSQMESGIKDYEHRLSHHWFVYNYIKLIWHKNRRRLTLKLLAAMMRPTPKELVLVAKNSKKSQHRMRLHDRTRWISNLDTIQKTQRSSLARGKISTLTNKTSSYTNLNHAHTTLPMSSKLSTQTLSGLMWRRLKWRESESKHYRSSSRFTRVDKLRSRAGWIGSGLRSQACRGS